MAAITASLVTRLRVVDEDDDSEDYLT